MYSPFAWQELTPAPVVGVDEAGRGCLVGPVYAGAVVLNTDKDYSFFTDSKLISENRREEIFEIIVKDHHVGIGFATVEEIEKLNILHAALLAMSRAVKNLNLETGHLLVDGNKKIPQMAQYQQTTLVKGDLRAAPVSAASIVAKVSRDRVLREMAQQYPEYGFEKHKGYGTKVHKEAIARFGPTPEHRRAFAGVKEHL